MTGLNTNKKWYLLFAMICLGYLWFFPYYSFLNNPNENVRLYQTRAMVEQGTFSIGESVLTRRGSKVTARPTGGVIGEWGWVNDKAVVCTDGAGGPPCNGILYPAKAPGLSFLAIPPYWLAKTITPVITGREPTKTEYIWVTRTWCVLIPSLLFLLFFRRRMIHFLTNQYGCRGRTGEREGVGKKEGEDPENEGDGQPDIPAGDLCPCPRCQSIGNAATLGTLALATGTMAFPYALLLTGHYLSALAIGTAFLLFYGSKHNPRRRTLYLALGGLLLGITPSLEYPATVPALIAGLYLLVAYWRRPRLLAAPVLAALVPGVLLAWYQYLVFGSPLSTPYDYLENVSFIRDMSPGMYGIHLPALKPLLGSLFSAEAGLFFFSPWLLLTIPGIILMVWPLQSSPDTTGAGSGGKSHRLEGLFLTGIFLSMILMLAAMPNWRIMLGWTAGPRYMAPMTTAAAIIACVAMIRFNSLPFRVVFGTLIALSAAITVPGAVLYPHYPMEFSNPVFQLAYPLMGEGYFPRNLGMVLSLPAGWPSALPGLLALITPLLIALYDYYRGTPLPHGEGPPVTGFTWKNPALKGGAGILISLIITAGTVYWAIPDQAEPLPGPIARQAAWVRRHWEPAPAPPAEPCELIQFRERRGEKEEVTRLSREHPHCVE